MVEIHCVPIFEDNYVWIIASGNQAWVVDPGDHLPVLRFLEQKQLQLSGILITHRHADHVHGVQPLVDHFSPKVIPVFGPHSPTIKHLISDTVGEGDWVHLGDMRAAVWYTPGHTLDHISYYFENEKMLFCGDTLFASGCGRLFDGTIEQLYQSLQRIAALPKDTMIYCSHEYTLANIGFALAVEPDNDQLLNRQKDCRKLRAAQQPTLPTPLKLELETNPFLRSHELQVKSTVRRMANASINTDFECFEALRNWKNGY